ncbi:MAG: molybdopterin-dependent oxidoreductase, partial [Planctomycetota bacterium]|nr:molybdopterin-dependent oxidoreductase [Planctomycetota bacterium]
MKISRREFLKGIGTAAASFATLGVSKTAFGMEEKVLPPRFAKAAAKMKEGICDEIPCSLCSVGCGLRMRIIGNVPANVEGATQHPINKPFLWNSGAPGYRSLCGKPFHLVEAMRQGKERILRHAIIRKRGGVFEKAEINYAVTRAATLIKETHSAKFTREDSEGKAVNRCEAIGFIGGSGLSNEECYAAQKLARGLGLVYIDTVTRSSIAPVNHAFIATFGRPGATNPVTDIVNSGAVLIVGADPATETPMIMRHVFDAVVRNKAKVVVIDSRQSGTAARAHTFAQVRPGTEFAFIMGLINSVLQDGIYVEEYLRHNTDAQFLIAEEFRTVADTDGVLSGYAGGEYDRSSWRYVLRRNGQVERDDRMRRSRVLLQVLKKHFSRYNESAVCRVTGVSRQTFRQVYRDFCEATAKTGVAGVILFGKGLTARSTGTQAVRALSILQLLLGNIGVSGGGLIPVVSEGNAQGASDFGLLFEFLPGYLPSPTKNLDTFEAYVKSHRRISAEPDAFNEWKNLDSYLASYLCDMYGATDLNTAYSYLPKRDPGKDYSVYGMLSAIENGEIEGLLVMGEDPVASLNTERWLFALSKLKWLVVFDWTMNDTAGFFEDKRFSSGGPEVILLPATPFVERQGSFTNISRWLQWQKPQAIVATTTERITGLDFLNRLYGLLSSGGTGFDEGIRNLNWEKMAMGDASFVLTMINGLDFSSGDSVAKRKLLRNPRDLKADGSTQCANRFYCGCASAHKWFEGANSIEDPTELGLYHKWGWSWPMNVRVMYNRAGVRREGTPFAKPLVTFRGSKWEGQDIVDGPVEASPKEVAPFVATPEGVAKLFAPDLLDGALPTYYEEPDLPFTNHFSPAYRTAPLLLIREGDSLFGERQENAKLVVAVKFSLGEHLGGGSLTRRLPFFARFLREFFVEVDSETAQELGITNGSKVRLRNL